MVTDVSYNCAIFRVPRRTLRRPKRHRKLLKRRKGEEEAKLKRR